MENVPFSRRLSKLLVGSISLAIISTLYFRVFVIWSQWKSYVSKVEKPPWIVSLMSEQRRAIIVMCLFSLLLNIVGFNWGEDQVVNIGALNWFNPKRLHGYQYKNNTFMRVVELFLFLIAQYMLRDFHENLSVGKELRVLLMINLFSICFYEMVKMLLGPGDRDLFVDECSIFNLNEGANRDLFRALIVTSVLLFFSKQKSVERVPSTFLQNFDDFTKDQECLEYFTKYTKHHNPDAVNDLNFLFSDLVIINPNQSRASICSERLKKCFEDYKLTKSFNTLRQLRVKNEKVMSKGYVSFR